MESDVKRLNLQRDVSGKTTDLQLRILDAGRRLFLDEGYSAITTDRLAKSAGVSKTSIYKYFGDMNGVFEAVVRSAGENFTMGVIEEPDTVQAFWLSLVNYGENLLKMMNRRDIIQFDQMIHEQARRHAEMARLFYETAYSESHTYLTRLIEHGKAKGFIRRPQRAVDLADHLLSIWEGLGFVRARLGLDDRPIKQPRKWSIQCVEALFGVNIRQVDDSEMD